MNATRYITALRFPLACLVVLIHAYNAAWRGVQDGTFTRFADLLSKQLPAFAVPLFFALSGFLMYANMPRYDGSVYGRKLWRRVFTLGIPYVVWNVLAWALYAVQDVAAGMPLQFPLTPDILWGCRVMTPAGTNFWGFPTWAVTAPVHEPLWFVRDLMVVVILAPLWLWMLRRWRVWGLLLLGFVYYSGLWPNPGGMGFMACWYFALGAWFSVSGTEVLKVVDRCVKPAFTLVFPSLLFVWLFDGTMGWQVQTVRALYVLCAMVCAVRMADVATRYRVPGTALAGSSFFIYAAHTIVLLPLTKVAATWAADLPAAGQMGLFLLCPVVAVLLCWGIYTLLRRYLPRASAPFTALWPKRS